MPPYNENLHVGELRDEDSGDEYVVLVCSIRTMQPDNQPYVQMNKFSVVPNHFLLISKGTSRPQGSTYILLMHRIIEYQSQSSALLPQDLVQTYKLLVEARKTGIKFFAFYNCRYSLTIHFNPLSSIQAETSAEPVNLTSTSNSSLSIQPKQGHLLNASQEPQIFKHPVCLTVHASTLCVINNRA